MKILVIQDRLRSGGTERQSIFLVRAFEAAGRSAELLTFRPGGRLAGGCAGIAFRSLQSTDLGLDWYAPGLLRAVGSAAPQVILCMGRMANCYAGRLQRRFPKTAVVATMRTGKTLPWLFRRSLLSVRHVIANSADARDRLVRRCGVPEGKITVIRNPLVLPSFSGGEAGRDAVRRELGAAPGAFVMICVAMFRREKNQAELIEIAAGLPAGLDWRLWLAGEGPRRAACERLARTLGLEGRIRFPGYRADPGALYSAADAAVHASTSESLSNFLIEAQAAGLPAIAYAAQGIGECIVPGSTGWIIARGDRPAFRGALERLSREPRDSRLARGAEARRHAREAFDPERQVAAHLELFGRLVNV